MDISCADISMLPLSIGSAGDMPRSDAQPRDYKSAMGGMTLDSASSTGEQYIEEEEKNPKIKVTEDEVGTE